MRRTALIAVAVMSLLAVVPAAPAAADSATLHDADDTFGPLDVKGLTHGHGESGLLIHTVEMHARWSNRALRGGYSSISLNFDTDADRRAERTLTIDRHRGSLFAEMRDARYRIVGYAKVWRVDARSVRVAFPRRLLRRGLDAYRWNATTGFAQPDNDRCFIGGDVVMACHDFVPDYGTGRWALRHVLR